MTVALRRRVTVYTQLARRAVAMARGESYWHVPQGPGKVFVPGELRGYFNDLTGKTEWRGACDQDGIPIEQQRTKAFVYHPITIFQKALGHWDCFIVDEHLNASHYADFLTLCEWALIHQDARGGWRIPFLVDNPLFLTHYSAMAQGQAASTLARAYAHTSESAFLLAAKQAIKLMLEPVTQGGTAHAYENGIVLEEYATKPFRTVLNGWIFALYGLYDVLCADDDPALNSALQTVLGTLVAALPRYDAGFWSWYDSARSIASPFYHALHIAQLDVLQRTFSTHADVFQQVRATFEWQAASGFNRKRAVALKVYQKLRHPPAFVKR